MRLLTVAAVVYRTWQCTLTESSFTPIHRKPTNSWRGWRPFPKFVLHRFYQNLLNPPPAPPPPVSPVPPAPTQKIQTTSPRTQFGSCIERKLWFLIFNLTAATWLRKGLPCHTESKKVHSPQNMPRLKISEIGEFHKNIQFSCFPPRLCNCRYRGRNGKCGRPLSIRVCGRIGRKTRKTSRQPFSV